MTGRARSASAPCPALAEVSTATDLCASYHETIPESSQRPHPVEVSCLGVARLAPKAQNLPAICAAPALLAVTALIHAVRIKISPLIIENQDQLIRNSTERL